MRDVADNPSLRILLIKCPFIPNQGLLIVSLGVVDCADVGSQGVIPGAGFWVRRRIAEFETSQVILELPSLISASAIGCRDFTQPTRAHHLRVAYLSCCFNIQKGKTKPFFEVGFLYLVCFTANRISQPRYQSVRVLSAGGRCIQCGSAFMAICVDNCLGYFCSFLLR